MADVAVRVVGLSYRYPDGTEALRDVDLLVRTGETVAVMGPNGAGKSTLMLHLNGILQGEGTVEVAGLEVNKKNMREVRGKVGLVFQDPEDQLFSPTVGEDVAFGPINMRMSAAQVDLAVKRALKWVGLDGFENRSPHHMSFGEKKRVSLATVLSMEPEILVLDEPVSNLDPRGRRHFLEIIGVLEATKLIVTHDLEMARKTAGRVVLMDDGRVVADGTTDSVLGDAALLERHGLL
ncbi:MAG: energy-coupling factor ABC transporter ATP-binding protein [Actinobacteria bacterium]|nr:energy-coupling factor ABC transporter ATP-binding protein [Actinomycetota bacterium]MBU1943380.1 energy-coupling factor ABC transporter ATP-binding protein [Actinomycetota bacterium]MBU2686737.1 energy-coupling factor ABC transporter ATP-binding protein [Actinomycetota bacterium]